MRVSIDDALLLARADLAEVCQRADPRSFALSLVRMADCAFVLPDEGDVNHVMHSTYGVPFLLSMLPRDAFRRTSWGPRIISDARIEEMVRALTIRAANVAYVERTLALARTGLGEVRDGDDALIIEYSADVHDLERHDTQDAFDYLEETSVIDEAEVKALALMAPRVAKLTRNLVGRSDEHFIRYGAHPRLDDYFQRSAALHCRSMLTRDTFDPDAVLGGLPFQVYQRAILGLTTLSLKHVAFAQALLARYPDMRPSNVMTILDEPRKLARSIAERRDHPWEAEDMDAALTALTVVLAEDSELLMPGESLPPLVAIAEGAVIRSVAGSLGSPFYYMLKHLRLRYRPEWDRAVQRREADLARHIESLFSREVFRIGRVGANLREHGKPVTDVDSSVFDPRSRTLALFQLKSQSPFGLSPKGRRSAASNLVEKGNEWIERVMSWMSRHGVEGLQRALRLPVEPVDHVRVFVITNAHANFSGRLHYDDRAAWGNWPQLARIRGDLSGQPDCISAVHAALAGEFRERREPGEVVRQTVRIDIGSAQVDIIGNARP